MLSLIFTFALSVCLYVPQDLWDWSPDSPHHQSVVTVHCEGGKGTGVVVEVGEPAKGGYLGKVLTASHVVTGSPIKVRYFNGRRARKCRVLARDSSSDVCLLLVWIPRGVKALELSPTRAARGDFVEIIGAGGNATANDPRQKLQY